MTLQTDLFNTVLNILLILYLEFYLIKKCRVSLVNFLKCNFLSLQLQNIDDYVFLFNKNILTLLLEILIDQYFHNIHIS